MNKQQFIELLCSKRDNCSESSGKTHFLTLARVWRIAHNKDKRYTVSKIPKTPGWVKKGLIEKINKLPLVPQRNLITSTNVYLQLTKASKKIQKLFADRMYEIVKQIRKEHVPHTRTEKRKKNWLTQDEISEFWQERLDIANKLLRKRFLSQKDKQEIQKTIIVAVHFGKGLPPSRLDWASSTWGDSDEGEDTRVYRKSNRWHVSIWGKTKRSYGKSVLKIHKPLSTLLTKFYKKTGTPGKRLFESPRGMPFTHNTYGNYIKRIFRKKFDRDVGSSLLRSIFISNKFSTLPKLLREYENVSRQMLHSSSESKKTYLKNQ